MNGRVYLSCKYVGIFQLLRALFVPEIGAMWPSGGGATSRMSSGCGGLPLTFDAMLV